MAAIDSLQARKEQADKIVSDVEIKSKQIDEKFKQTTEILNKLNSSDKKYKKLIEDLNKITESANISIGKFQIERQKIVSFLKQANKFYNEKYLPLVGKIEDKEKGFLANIRKGNYCSKEIAKISKDCQQQYTKIKNHAEQHKIVLRNLQGLEKSVLKIYQNIQDNEADSIKVTNSIKEANKRVEDFEKNISNLNGNSIEFEANITKLLESSNTSFQRIEGIKSKSESTFNEILNIYEMAADTGRSGEFDKRRKILSNELSEWKINILITTLILFVVVIGLFIFQLWMDNWNLKELSADVNFYIRFAVTSPIIYLIYFANTQYNKTRKLVDKYSFKTTLAVSIKSHLELLSTNPKFDKENHINDILKFSLSALENIYHEPYSDDELKVKLKIMSNELNLEKTIGKKVQEQFEYVTNDIMEKVKEEITNNGGPILKKGVVNNATL